MKSNYYILYVYPNNVIWFNTLNRINFNDQILFDIRVYIIDNFDHKMFDHNQGFKL